MTPNTPPTSSDFADDVRVTRDGFEFHICYRTRFGENKTEKLEAALEAFQRMRAFKPHINIQKSGIRLVVTRWDGENFLEEHGIENLEHSSPEQVENLIRSYLLGGAEEGQPQTAGSGHARIAKGGIVHVGVVRKPSETRCHLVFRRQNGTSEQGPLLIRPNLARLAAERIFRPDVSISMTALSDRIIIEHDAPSGTGRCSETLPLDRPEDLGRVEALLNACLPEVTSLASVPTASSALPRPEGANLDGATNHALAPAQTLPQATVKPDPHLDSPSPVIPPEVTPPQPAPVPPITPAKLSPAKEGPTPESLVKAWGESLFKAVEGRPP